MRTRTGNRFTALLLTLCLLFTMMPAFTVTASAAQQTQTITSGIKAASDDMEEWITYDTDEPGKVGALDYDSSDLEIGYEKPEQSGDALRKQYVGLRFAELEIPAGATITKAYVQFTVDESKAQSNPLDIYIVAEDTANSATFNGGTYGISSRSTTSTVVRWTSDSDGDLWLNEYDSGEKQTTPDLSSLVQTIVDKSDWNSGKAISFIMWGTGNRTAISYDRVIDEGLASTYVPTLHVTYTTESADSNTVDFAVLSTTDMHGKCWDENVLTGGTVDNSMLKVATAVYDIREDIGEDNVVLIDNGDLFQGTPVSTYHIAQLTKYLSSNSTSGINENLIDNGSFLSAASMALCLKYIGYDAAVLGNHELNYDWDAMNSIYDYLEDDVTPYDSVPVLAANLYWDGTDGIHTAGDNAFTPYITKDITVGEQTFTIGILGLENTDCARWDVPDNYPGITFATDSTAEVKKYVPEMQAAGCDFIILSYHSGMGSTSGNLEFGVNTENQIARVIQNTTGIDMVIAGHDHSTSYSNDTYENKDGDDVLVVNGGGSQLTKSVFTAALDTDTNSIEVTLKNSQNLNLSSYENDAALKPMIAPYAAAASDYVNQEVGTLTGDWDSVKNFYLEQSDTIDLINRAEIAGGTKYMAEKYDTQAKLDALYSATGLDHISVDMASTSVVVDNEYTVSAGALSMKDIYKMYKYDNTLYLLPLTGQKIKDILEYNAQERLSASVSGGEVHYSPIGDSFTNPVFYGLDFTYDMALEAGSRVLITGFANGDSFDLNKTYILAVNNYHLGNGPFSDYSSDNAIWSQTDDLGGGVVQDLIADFVSDETTAHGGVSPDPSEWSLSYSGSLEDNLSDTAYIAYPASEAPANGDTVIIYYNNDGTVASDTAATGYGGSNILASANVTMSNNVLYADDTAAAFGVHYDSGTGYYTFTCDGKYLTSGAAGNSLSLTDSLDADGCSYWTLKATDGGWLIRNVGAVHDGANNQYLEYYSGFTTYGYPPKNTAYEYRYVFSFYTVVPAATLTETAPANGDQVVIWYNAGNQIIGSEGNADGRLKGIASATAGDLLPVYEGSAAFDVHYDSGTGYYTFTCGDKYLTSTTANDLNLTDSLDSDGCSYWTLEPTDGGWLVRNANAQYYENDVYLEYYSTGFTTYKMGTTLSNYTFNFYDFNGYAPEAPNANEDQAAPTGLTGVAPTTASNDDGQITGTTTEMEYKLSSASSWTACPGTSVGGLLPGSYEVRYAAKTGYNASPSVAVTVPYNPLSSYIAKNLTIQPGADESGMNFCWFSGSGAAAQVQIAEKSAMTSTDFPVSEAVTFNGTVVASDSFISNEVRATGLSAGTEYVYRVGDGAGFSSVYSFKTHDNISTSYSAILVGDPQIGASDNVGNDRAGWQTTLTNALTKFPETSFILSAGDQVESASSTTYYDSFFTPTELRSMPLVPTIGNHDNGSLYKDHFSSPNESGTYGTTSAGGDYWFKYGNTLYMNLNSNNQSVASHEEFMKQTLDAEGGDVTWKVVMFHHSIYSSASHSDDNDILTRRSDLYPVFDKLDIDVVLAGHDHCYTRTYQMEGGIAQNGLESSVENPVGTLYVTANSASGSKYYDLKNFDTGYSAVRWQGHNTSYSNVEVTDTSFTITTYLSSDNTVIDAYTITKDQSGAPAGLEGIMATTEENNDGRITGTTAEMQYKLSTATTWTSCSGTETTNLAPGTYDVRFKAAGGSGPSVSTVVVVKAFAVVSEDQEAPTKLSGVAPTTTANEDGKITGTTAQMEYKLTADNSDNTIWTACTGELITGLLPDSYDVRYVERTGFNASPATTVVVPAYSSGKTHTVASRVKAASDDMEEWLTNSDETEVGTLDYNSSDLELGWEKPNKSGDALKAQAVGIRFADIEIPAGASIQSAYIQFAVDEFKEGAYNPFNVNIAVEDTANSTTFNNGNTTETVVPYDISTRTVTDTKVNWYDDGEPWTTEDAMTADQRTPDLVSLVKAIVGKSGWASGNAITFIITGTGNRTAISFDENPALAPTLHVTYTYGSDNHGGNHGSGSGSNPVPDTEGDTTATSGNKVNASIAGTTSAAGKTSASVSSDIMATLVDNAKQIESLGKTSVVQINVEESPSATSVELKIGEADLKALASGTDADVSVSTSVATVTFDKKTVDTLSSAAKGDFTIGISSVESDSLDEAVKAAVGDRPVFSFSVKSGNTKISDFGKGNATVSIPYSLRSGEEPEAVVVYYIDASGNLQTVRGRYDASENAVVFVTSHFSNYMIGYNKISFADVSSGNWYADPVAFIAARGITNGVDGVNYGAGQSITRGQFLVMIMRAYGIEPLKNSSDNFADAGDTYYTGYLAAAKKLGITDGIGSNLYAPESSISRQDAFTQACRVLNVLDESPEISKGKTISSFSDSGSVADYAEESLNTLIGAGIVSGSGGRLNPAGLCTRAEMAQIIYNLLSI